MKERVSGKKVAGSSVFRRALKKAQKYAQDAKKLNQLIDRAISKARAQQERLHEARDKLLAFLRLLRAYAGGRYRDVPWASLVSITATVIYFVMPLDLIPDFLLGYGFIDDAALLGWIYSTLSADVERFIEWERNQAQQERAIIEPGGME